MKDFIDASFTVCVSPAATVRQTDKVSNAPRMSPDLTDEIPLSMIHRTEDHRLEQYLNQQPVAAEPAKKPLGLPIASLIIGAVATGISAVLFMLAVMKFVGVAAASAVYGATSLGMGGTVVIVISVAVMLLSIVGAVLGLIGLVKSIHRETRSVKGIILSALGVDFTVGSVILCIVTIVFTAVAMHTFM